MWYCVFAFAGFEHFIANGQILFSFDPVGKAVPMNERGNRRPFFRPVFPLAK
jgi:hypothetical protein